MIFGYRAVSEFWKDFDLCSVNYHSFQACISLQPALPFEDRLYIQMHLNGFANGSNWATFFQSMVVSRSPADQASLYRELVAKFAYDCTVQKGEKQSSNDSLNSSTTTDTLSTVRYSPIILRFYFSIKIFSYFTI